MQLQVSSFSMPLWMRRMLFLLLLLLLSSSVLSAASASSATTAHVPVVYDQARGRELLGVLNSIREENGSSKLSYDYDLEQVAMQRAAETALYFSHVRPGGGKYIALRPYLSEDPNASAEMLARGWSTPQRVMDAFMDEPQQTVAAVHPNHRTIALSSRFKAVGVGCAYIPARQASGLIDQNIYYWVVIMRDKNSGKDASSPFSMPDTVQVTVSRNYAPLTMKLQKDSLVLNAGERITLPCAYFQMRPDWFDPTTGKISGEGAKALVDVSWVSGDNSVARVSNGEVWAVGGGKTTLTASGGGFNATLLVTVSGSPAQLKTPKLKSVTGTAKGIKLQWNNVGAAKYRIFYKANGKGKWVKITDTTNTSYEWKAGNPNRNYAFAIRCLSANGKSFTSGYKSYAYKPNFATPSAAVVRAQQGITIKWNNTGAAKYRVFFKANGKWKKLADTTSNVYRWKTANPTKKICIAVRGISADGKAYTSNYKSVIYKP